MASPGLIEPIGSDWPDAPANVGALASTRRGGFSLGPYGDGTGGGGLNLGLHVGDDAATVQRNRAALRGLLPGAPAWISQVHGIAVVDAASVQPGQPVRVADMRVADMRVADMRVADASIEVKVGDASIATTPGVVCAVMTADCLPVLFADLDGKVVGAAHAGWRGLAAGVLGATVAAMRAAGAGELTAWLGPAIGPAQFEVGADVLDTFVAGARNDAQIGEVRAAFAPYEGRPGKYLADMNALARGLLARDGVTRVWGGGHCTATEADRFYSYRRDGVTGRQASLIWLKA
jgi:YfiH family protein